MVGSGMNMSIDINVNHNFMQMQLLTQYFAGEQFDQIISLISLMCSQDEVNYEIGLMYMKELKLYSAFIKMLDEYYNVSIHRKIEKGVQNLTQLTELAVSEYETFLLNYSFCPNGCDLISCGDGEAVEVAFKYNVFEDIFYLGYYFNLKTPYKIPLPLFNPQIDTLELKGGKIYEIANGNHIASPFIEYIVTNTTILNLPATKNRPKLIKQ